LGIAFLVLARDDTSWQLFVPSTGLSFYTSEKTLRAAFEGFGELVEGSFIFMYYFLCSSKFSVSKQKQIHPSFY